jgi:pyruvate dehydrogenase E2 component (dihydrolipoamide acetyltransferase)
VIEFRMPSLGADMEAGTIVEWRVAPGDAVERGDIVALVDTEKAEIEVEIWEPGVVKRLVVPEGRQVPVGTVIAELEERRGAGARPASGPPQAPPEPAPISPAATPIAAPIAPPPPPVSGRVRASPLARRLAAERGVDLSQVEPSGSAGAISKADVERAAGLRAVGQEAPRPEPADRAASMRRAIAAAMARSKREIPHYYLETSIDLSAAMAWLEAQNQRREISRRLLPSVLLVKATALALEAAPELNGHFVDGVFRPSAARHLGMAIALRGGGLMAPAIHDVDRLELDALMDALRDLVGRTRKGGLRSSEVTDATLTVTSLGDLGVETVYGVIYPPQVALVGFGRIAERPWAEDGALGVRPVVTATLAADHRVSDGVRGARFLGALAERLAHPEDL